MDDKYKKESEQMLRDLFAGFAIQGYLASAGDDVSINPTDAAEYAFKVSDAMMAERAKREAK